jgi:hypothetical protein
MRDGSGQSQHSMLIRRCDTNGRVPTLDEAKAQFQSSWSAVVEARNEKGQQS